MNHDDFLLAIRDDPSDVPRLVYADWLEEQGDPRAEFIRVQCELAPLTETDERWPALKAREAELLDRHRKAWVSSLRGLVRDCEFRRGFVAMTVVEGATFLERAEDLWRKAPVEEVRLLEAGRLVHKIAAMPALERLTALGLNGNYIDSRGVAALVSSPHVARLVRLNLCKNNIEDEGASALAGTPYLGALELLDLSHNRITLRGATMLADSTQLAALTAISLRNNWIPWPDHPGLRERFGSRQCLL